MLTKNVDPDIYWYSSYGIGFDALLIFSVKVWWKKSDYFCVDNGLSVHADNRKTDIQMLGETPRDELKDIW